MRVKFEYIGLFAAIEWQAAHFFIFNIPKTGL